jgi:hypothetical protein
MGNTVGNAIHAAHEYREYCYGEHAVGEAPGQNTVRLPGGARASPTKYRAPILEGSELGRVINPPGHNTACKANSRYTRNQYGEPVRTGFYEPKYRGPIAKLSPVVNAPGTNTAEYKNTLVFSRAARSHSIDV